MSITKKDLGVDPLTGLHVFEVMDDETEQVIGYDYVSPEE
jgi:hypothetical protein